MGQYLTRDDILHNSRPPKRQEVDCPEWGGKVLVQELSGKDRDSLENQMAEIEDTRVTIRLANFRARLMTLACVSEDGFKVFRLDDAEALGEKSGAALTRVAGAAAEISAMRAEDVQKLVKN